LKYGGVPVKIEIQEGPKARANFERAMKAVFRVPKSEVVKAEKKHKAERKRKKFSPSASRVLGA